ncbi:hypothetical protein COCNU_16G000280 [Cocos nucifera]|uniref:Uncharacterized protein n=1 Tax=Cocos nucifera TaxID=13894 RepID=A0A8K0IXX6_COCNU|nr:hypothetical protein COCNU_16G000280 [Cocos nucifera]
MKDSLSVFLEVGHQLIANIKAINIQSIQTLEAIKIYKEYKAEVDDLLKEKSVEVGHLQVAVRSAEQTSVKVKDELALEVERRKKAEAKVAERKGRLLKPKKKVSWISRLQRNWKM